jgi:phenylpropionate dioxygenase-like ring-hydroxylating dioxygenase large terminal subunit
MSEVVDKPRADSGRGGLRDVPFRVTNPERIPKQRYYDPEFYGLEVKHFWPKVWQMAAWLEEIPEVGDWVEYKILDKSVFVVRTREGVRAFHNHCRHRGVKLLSGHGNCAAQGITCPFHGWRWDMDGKNTFVFFKQVFSEENLKPEDLNLVPCRVELWGGCAFINFDDDAAPLLDCIKPFAELHAPLPLEQLKIDWWVAIEAPANWKLMQDAFVEDYHLMGSHPQLHSVLVPEADMFRTPESRLAVLRAYGSPEAYVDSWLNCMEVIWDGMRSLVTPSDIAAARSIKDTARLPAEVEAAPPEWYRQVNDAITQAARARNIPMPDLNALPPIPQVNFCFPNFFLLPTFGNMGSYRIRPLGPEKCLFEVWGLSLYPTDETRPRPLAPKPVPHDDPSFPLIPSQDCANVVREQQGLHAQGFEYMRLAREVEGSISNYNRVIDGFLAGVDKASLVRAMQVASTPLDSPILDIGF